MIRAQFCGEGTAIAANQFFSLVQRTQAVPVLLINKAKKTPSVLEDGKPRDFHSPNKTIKPIASRIPRRLGCQILDGAGKEMENHSRH